jgi:hypothetical protein
MMNYYPQIKTWPSTQYLLFIDGMVLDEVLCNGDN